jgi:WD40 repeat protein
MLWDVLSGQLLRIFRHKDGVQGVSFSADGRSVLTGSLDDTAKLWDAQGGFRLLAVANEDDLNSRLDSLCVCLGDVVVTASVA